MVSNTQQGSQSEGTPQRLRRRLGTGDAMALALGAMTGAGIFVTLGQAAAVTGGGLLLAIPLAALVATCNALSSVELGVNYPRAGGGYEFGYRELTPLVGFLAGWVFLLAALMASATYTLAFAAYFAPLLPGLSPVTLGVALALAAVVVTAIGTGFSARVNNVLVGIKIGALILFVALALPRFSTGNLVPLLPGGISGVLQAAALLFFAFTGYARPVTVVEEIREPERALPRAVGAALVTATSLYLAVAVMALGALGPAALGASDAPLRDALGGSHPGALLMSLAALVATASVLVTEIWGISRLAFAMARRGDLPAMLGRLVGAQRNPRNAVLLLGAIIIVLTATLDLRSLLSASSLGLLLYYATVNLSALHLEPRKRLYTPVVPTAGFLACVLLALSLPASALLTVAGMILLGILYFYATRARRQVDAGDHAR